MQTHSRLVPAASVASLAHTRREWWCLAAHDLNRERSGAGNSVGAGRLGRYHQCAKKSVSETVPADVGFDHLEIPKSLKMIFISNKLPIT